MIRRSSLFGYPRAATLPLSLSLSLSIFICLLLSFALVVRLSSSSNFHLDLVHKSNRGFRIAGVQVAGIAAPSFRRDDRTRKRADGSDCTEISLGP